MEANRHERGSVVRLTYFPEIQTLIVKVPSREHEIAQPNIGQLLTRKVPTPKEEDAKAHEVGQPTTCKIVGRWPTMLFFPEKEDFHGPFTIDSGYGCETVGPMSDYLDEDRMREKMGDNLPGAIESIPSSPLALAVSTPAHA
ncbi:hypothetical protein Aspvir_006376 [Aspergillus viridinutans]|uniref:Uncharacterized protein n=1 Tax=Aspergillus viridinutans TaxID=75553 RepID=A0A9P3BYZ6_ASPVI|nr:uncharacterized protein Aspvir_006376 [Aspergillus viridinutans]GIK02327.1 hypothetical protein Aspvir_006376 [Aspergillus viridinutans]